MQYQFRFSRFFISSAATATLSTIAFCDASFNTSSYVQLTTAELGGQGIDITFTTNLPTTSGLGDYSASGYESFFSNPMGTTDLYFALTTFAGGSATGVSSASASATENQIITFSNKSNAAQTFSVNWTYQLNANVYANNGSAAANSTTGGYRIAGNFDWNDQSLAFTPNMLSATSNISGSITMNLAAESSSNLYLTGASNGLATSNAAATPEPSGLAALGVGAFGICRAMRRKRS